MENIKQFLMETEQKLLEQTGNLRLFSYKWHCPNYLIAYEPLEEAVPKYNSAKEFLEDTRCVFDHITVDSETKLQCLPRKYRSFGDIFLICKQYYPETSLLDICYILETLDRKGLIYYFRCPDIGKRVVAAHYISSSYTNKDEDELFITREMLTEIYNNYETIKSS